MKYPTTTKLYECFKFKTYINNLLEIFEEQEEKNHIQEKLKQELRELKERLEQEIDYLCSTI